MDVRAAQRLPDRHAGRGRGRGGTYGDGELCDVVDVDGGLGAPDVLEEVVQDPHRLVPHELVVLLQIARGRYLRQLSRSRAYYPETEAQGRLATPTDTRLPRDPAPHPAFHPNSGALSSGGARHRRACGVRGDEKIEIEGSGRTSENAGATSLRWRFHSSPSDATRLGPNASRILYGPMGFGKRARAPMTSFAHAYIQSSVCMQRRAEGGGDAP